MFATPGSTGVWGELTEALKTASPKRGQLSKAKPFFEEIYSDPGELAFMQRGRAYSLGDVHALRGAKAVRLSAATGPSATWRGPRGRPSYDSCRALLPALRCTPTTTAVVAIADSRCRGPG